VRAVEHVSYPDICSNRTDFHFGPSDRIRQRIDWLLHIPPSPLNFLLDILPHLLPPPTIISSKLYGATLLWLDHTPPCTDAAASRYLPIRLHYVTWRVLKTELPFCVSLVEHTLVWIVKPSLPLRLIPPHWGFWPSANSCRIEGRLR
jgi:hypothetical protein